MIKLLTVKEVAEQLGVEIRTVYGYIKEGTLKAHKMGKFTQRKHWRVKEEDLLAFIDNGNEEESDV